MKTLVIVGVGALGSHLALLVRNTEATIRVVDFDRVESKNVASQFHGRTGVGKAKVVALQQVMLLLFGRKVDPIPHKLVGDNAQVILAGADLVVDCLDNGDGRRVVQQNARSLGTPCLHGALATDGQFGRVVWDEQFEVDDEVVGAATCDNGMHLPFIAVVASYLAHAAQTFLLTQRKVGYNIHPGGSNQTWEGS